VRGITTYNHSLQSIEVCTLTSRRRRWRRRRRRRRRNTLASRIISVLTGA